MVTQMDAGTPTIARGKWTDYLNWGSASAFILGVGFLVLFAWLNL